MISERNSARTKTRMSWERLSFSQRWPDSRGAHHNLIRALHIHDANLRSWFRFCNQAKFDATEILLGLVANEHKANSRCKMFLRWMVNTSKKSTTVLDECESIQERSINSITTVNNIWNRIMVEGDRIVYAPH